MPEDRSLDEFEGSDDGAADADSTDSGPPETDDPIPATPTATWTTEGADCERCGDRVERRWFDDGDLVCPDCKPW